MCSEQRYSTDICFLVAIKRTQFCLLAKRILCSLSRFIVEMSNLFDFDPREDDEEESDFDPFETSSDDEEYLPEPGENDESSEYESDDDVVDNEPQQHETTCSEPKEFVLSKDGKYCYYFEPPPQLPNRSNASFALHETPGKFFFIFYFFLLCL